MSQKDGMTEGSFLAHIERTRGAQMASRCQILLSKSDHPDYFAVLYQATLESPEHRADMAVATALAAKPITTTFRRRLASEREEDRQNTR